MESIAGGRKVRQEDDTFHANLKKLTEIRWSTADAKAALKQRPNLDSAVELLLRQTSGTSNHDEDSSKDDGRPSRYIDETSCSLILTKMRNMDKEEAQQKRQRWTEMMCQLNALDVMTTLTPPSEVQNIFSAIRPLAILRWCIVQTATRLNSM